MQGFIEKITAIPLPVWGVLAVFSVLFFLFTRATNPTRAKKDLKVSKPVKPLANGSPYLQARFWRGPAEDQEDRLLTRSDQNNENDSH